MKVVIDTSLVIDFLRRSEAKKSPYIKLSAKVEKVMSLISVAELYSGRSVNQEGHQRVLLEEMLAGVEIVAPILETAKEVGQLRAQYELSLADAFVASLALELKIPLATLDIRDFRKVEGLQLYTL